ncbi:MAG: serine/threonine-protein kinase [Gemmatales bacterium]
MPLDMQVLNSLFQAARELNPEARKQYLDEVCGTDATMRKQLEDMLDAHHEHRTPTPQGPTQADPQYQPVNNAHLNLKPGDILENTYQIIEKISQGGMGAVYRAARVTDLKMEVAIKVIKPGLASPQTLARFNNEKQALAIMKHENISRVLDAGTTPSGLPFFVMELVKGVSITQFCDDNKLTVRERLELFVPVCEAIQHAHLKGVVHRDLKPSNILVALYDDKAVPKIIDFGLAKALHQPLTDDIVHTGFKTFVGTYQYAAPEQAQLNNLDIDTRADIYSLGVVLYELLTGAPTLSKERITNLIFDEVLRAIREEEPPRPSTKLGSSDKLPSLAALRRCEPVQLKQQIQGEIDWIVMKALEKERSRRFESANAFAADLRRYLSGEAVQSGPASWSYRTGKYLKKHRGKVIAGGLLAAAILVGSVVSTIGWVTASRERARADERTATAQAVNEFYLREVMSMADPNIAIKPGQTFESNVSLVKALLNAEEHVGVRFRDSPELEVKIRFSLGKVFKGLGVFGRARVNLEIAEAKQRQLNGEDDVFRLTALTELGHVVMLLSDFQSSERLLIAALEGRTSALGKTHPDTLFTRYILAVTQSLLGKHEESRNGLEFVLRHQEKGQPDSDLDILCTKRELATQLVDSGEAGQACVILEQVLIGIEKHFTKRHPQYINTLNNYAYCLQELKQFAKAEVLMKEVVALSSAVHGHENAFTNQYRAQFASVLYDQKRFDDALREYASILPFMNKVNGPQAMETIVVMQGYGTCLAMKGRYDESEHMYLSALDICQKRYSENHECVAALLDNIIKMYKMKGDTIRQIVYESIQFRIQTSRRASKRTP